MTPQLDRKYLLRNGLKVVFTSEVRNGSGSPLWVGHTIDHSAKYNAGEVIRLYPNDLVNHPNWGILRPMDLYSVSLNMEIFNGEDLTVSLDKAAVNCYSETWSSASGFPSISNSSVSFRTY